MQRINCIVLQQHRFQFQRILRENVCNVERCALFLSNFISAKQSRNALLSYVEVNSSIHNYRKICIFLGLGFFHLCPSHQDQDHDFVHDQRSAFNIAMQCNAMHCDVRVVLLAPYHLSYPSTYSTTVRHPSQTASLLFFVFVYMSAKSASPLFF